MCWDDLFRGKLDLDPSVVGGDFLVAREGLGPSYQLAVVVDDAAMGVNQVVRGADLVPSTPRQILLDRAFGVPEPRFGHVPLVLGPDGRRLAKRDRSITLAALRARGVDPSRLVARLGSSLGIDGLDGFARPADLIGRFNPARVPAEAFAVDWEDAAIESMKEGKSETKSEK